MGYCTVHGNYMDMTVAGCPLCHSGVVIDTYKIPGPYAPIGSCPTCAALRARVEVLEKVAAAAKELRDARTAYDTNKHCTDGSEWARYMNAFGALDAALAALEGRKGGRDEGTYQFTSL